MTKTAFISHPDCLLHEMGSMHPEQPARITAIKSHLQQQGLWEKLQIIEAEKAEDKELAQTHSPDYVSSIRAAAPEYGEVSLDPDTSMNPHSLNAALYAAGGAILATDLVLEGKINNAFCCVRPPGHHAEKNRVMGFCLFNNVAVAAHHALAKGIKRVAILDFDVHHGNGTEDIFLKDERVLFCSTFQHPYYPFSSLESSRAGIIKSPLEAGAGSEEFRNAVTNDWLPALESFKPEMIFVSAGFDAHEDDFLASLNFTDDDYQWVTQIIKKAAEKHAKGRIVSCLEGGYNLDSLGRGAAAHIAELLK